MITEVDARGATVELADSVMGYIRASEISRERVEDASAVLKVGDEVEAKFIAIDRKSRSLNLSIKAKDVEEEAEVIRSYSSRSQAATGGTLGDLLKEQMESGDND